MQDSGFGRRHYKAMKDDMENLEPLDDSPDEETYIRMKMGLEPHLTFDEAVHFQIEHDIKQLAKERGWTWR